MTSEKCSWLFLEFSRSITASTYNIMTLTAAPDDLRCHVLDGAAEGVSPALSTTELLGETEVCQHDMTFRVKEDVLELDVTVDNAELVEKRDDTWLKLVDYC